MTYNKPTVNERLGIALQIANSNNMGLAVRLAKVEAVLTRLCEHLGVEVTFDESEIQKAVDEMLKETMDATTVQNMPDES